MEEIVHLLAGGSSREGTEPAVAKEAARAKAVALAGEILSGTLGILEGARLLSAHRFHVGVPEDDPDFTSFVAIDSETDALPIGRSRMQWAPEVLAEKDLEIARAEQWARGFGLESCRNVVARFGRAG
jgi:hypothetical protein